MSLFSPLSWMSSLTLLAQDAPSLPEKIAHEGMGMHLPPQASENAHRIDELYMFISWVGVIFTVLIFGVLFLFIWKYREKKHPKAERTSNHNTALELVWSILPGFVLAYMFWVGFKDYLDFRTPPADSYEVMVTGQKWKWSFTYPNGAVWDELHVPVNTPVTLRITSDDVLHSFFVPAFRTKMDAVPGRYTKSWFTPTIVGEYAALCTEYCGTQHSDMLAKVIVEEADEHEAFLKKAAIWWDGMTPIDVGKRVYEMRGCGQCHSVEQGPDGNAVAGQGPGWFGIYGKNELTNVGSKTVDENYIRESILEPNAAVLNGFNAIMPTFKGRLQEPEIEGLIAYIKSLGA